MGWIVIEDFDPASTDRGFVGVVPDGHAVVDYLRIEKRQLMEQHGLDPAWGRSLYRDVVALGSCMGESIRHLCMTQCGSAAVKSKSQIR